MADWRSCDATNEPDSCLYCGRGLRHNPIRIDNPEYKTAKKRRDDSGDLGVDSLLALPPYTIKTGYEEKGGSYADGFFCGLRCGYSFGLAFARAGRRLAPKPRS